jgi:hypothetical protein
MPEATALERLLQERMAALGLSRGSVGERLSPANPSKALRRLDDFSSRGVRPSEDLPERLAAVLGVSEAELMNAARATREVIEAQGEADYRARFQPHAIWTTVRSQPSSTAMAGFINAPVRLMLSFPADLSTHDFVAYCQAQAPKGVPLYGPVTGFIINYTPDRAVRYDLNGETQETRDVAMRVSSAAARV